MTDTTGNPAMSAALAIRVTVDLAPEDEDEFRDWCSGYGFDVLNSGRRAWCSQFATYFRDAVGVATTRNGESFLVYEDDVIELVALAPDGPDQGGA